MKILEFQGKKIFKKYGLPIPRGIAADSPEEAGKAAETLGDEVIVKAQVHTGGRGKAGGIKAASNPDEAVKKAREILNMEIKGFKVRKVYIEEKVSVLSEYYLALTLDRFTSLPVLIFSSEGGVDIEMLAKDSPEKVVRQTIDPLWGLHQYQLRKIILKTGVPFEISKEVISVISKLYDVFIKEDASLVEINPLLVTSNNELVCGDSKLVYDNSALYRHPEVVSEFEMEVQGEFEREAKTKGLSFVKLDGEIGIIGNGAGLVMSTLDSIYLEGGTPANFMDIGGGALSTSVEDALELLLKMKDVKVIFINIFGGITRCDEVAKGVIAALENSNFSVPIVVRLAGTEEEKGRQILKESGMPLHIFETMRTAAKNAVRFSGGI